MKKNLAEAKGAKNAAEWAKDEALRAKEEAVFAKAKAESSKEKAGEEAYDLGMAETQATLKAQVPGVCKLYCSQVWNETLKQARIKASSDLWKVENVYYLLTIRETAPSNSKARDVLEEAEAAGLEVVVATTAPNKPAKESEPSGAVKTSEGLNPEAPQKAVKSTAEAQATHTKKPALLVEPLQAVPPSEGCKDFETTSTQLFKEGIKAKPKK